MKQSVHYPKAHWAWFFLILLVTFFVYVPAIRDGGFIWDDDDYVTENPTLRTADGLRRIWLELGATPQYYPLVHTSFWIEYHFWKLNPAVYHFNNVLIHGLNTFLLGLILQRLSIRGAWFGALLFAVHPVHVESVAWITERKNVLSAFFYLSSLLCYLRFHSLQASGKQGPWSMYGTSLALYLFALFSKTITCSLPVGILLILWWKDGKITRKSVIRLVPFFLIGLLMGLVTIFMEKDHVGAQGPEWNFSILDRVLIAGRAVWFYISKLLWPQPLIFIYPRWHIDDTQLWQYLFPVSLIAILTVVMIYSRRTGRGHGILVAFLYFILTLSPALGFINVYPMRYSFVADHFQYLASVSIIALFGSVIIQFLEKRAVPQIRTIACGLMIVLLGFKSWHQEFIYQNADSVWHDTISKNPEAWMSHHNLGVSLASQGKLEEALDYYRETLRLKSDHVEARNNMGLALVKLGRPEEALAQYQEALEIQPNHASTYVNLGVMFNELGRTNEAFASFQNAIKANPSNASAHSNLANLLAANGDISGALKHYRMALDLDPLHSDAHSNLGITLARTGEMQEALIHFREAVNLKPDNSQARFNLGIALVQTGSVPEGIRELKKVLAERPDDPDALHQIALAFQKNGQRQEAIAHLEQAISLQPDAADSMLLLAEILLSLEPRSATALKQAAVLMERVRSLVPVPDPELLHSLTSAYIELSEFHKARQTLAEALAIASESGNEPLVKALQKLAARLPADH